MVLFGGTARGDNPRPFGSAGQLAISWDQPLAGASLDSSGLYLAPLSLAPLGLTDTALSGGGSLTFFELAPAADYFVSDGVSLGAQVIIAHSGSSSLPKDTESTPNTTDFGIAPELGYDIRLSDSVTFWPKAFLSLITAATSGGGGATSGTLGVYAPFLWHPVPHFYMGLGPNLSTMLFENEWPGGGGPGTSVSSKPTTFGVMATFGGWFLGESRPVVAEPPVPSEQPAQPEAPAARDDDRKLFDELQALCADGNDGACRALQFATKKRGCCAGHGGVRKCDDQAHVMCMDGTPSATCSCTATEMSPSSSAPAPETPAAPPATSTPGARPPAPPPPPTTANCKPPTWIDDSGHIHLKPGCK
jgi:hypothetical protein